MAFAAHLIIDGKQEFFAMELYYRMFPHEKSTKIWFDYDLLSPVRISNLNYEKLLDTMIGMRTSSPTIDNFVIVVHGLHDQKDFGWGMAIPMADGAAMKCSYEVLKPLIDLRDAGGDPADFEENYSYTNKNLKLTNVKYPKGSVARMLDKMRQLQKLKVRIVELRACTLGTNPTGLKIVGESLGARFIIAPDVHMFWVSTGVNGALISGPAFGKLWKGPRRWRKFVNPTNANAKLAIGVGRGPGFTFNTTSMTNTVDLKWFTDAKLWPASTYVNGKSRPTDFFMEGMFVSDGNYALPQEQDYCDHLVEAGPLAGNLI
jgi:hypothetical protein